MQSTRSFTILPAFLLALATAASAATIPRDGGLVQAIFYSPNGTVGACGNAIQNTDFAVALNTADFANGASCGEKLTVSFQGASITTVVQDVCPECATPGGIKLTSFVESLTGTTGPIEVTTSVVVVPPPVLIDGSVKSYVAGVGACLGMDIKPTDFVAALGETELKGGVECGKNITVTLNGTNVTASVQDSCTDCAAGDFELSAPAFEALTGSQSTKSVEVVWFIDTE
ncbi:hypothetical protein C8R47DRAFT_1026051 [Mycena vitilis]|nr:hypothetical protein C8R47DRAFT_1026051 [Mycena vitilis]